MRSLILTWFGCTVAVAMAWTTVVPSPAFAQEEQPEALTPEQQALEKEFESQFQEFLDLAQASKFDEAIEAGKRVLATLDKIKQDDFRVAPVSDTIGLIYESREQFAEAKPYYQRSIEVTAVNFTEASSEFADAEWRLKKVEILEKMTPEQRAELGRARDLKREALDAHRKFETDRAITLYAEAMALFEKLLPSPHPELADAHGAFGMMLLHSGRYIDARPHLEAALAINEALYPEDKVEWGHPNLAVAIGAVAQMQQSIGDFATARAGFERALDKTETLFPPEYGVHSELITAILKLADAEFDAGDFAAAHHSYRRALELGEKVFENPDATRAAALRNLGEALVALGELEEAQANFEASLNEYRQLFPAEQFPSGRPPMAAALFSLARLESKREHHDRARELGNEAFAMIEGIYTPEQFPQGHPTLGAACNNMASILAAAKDRDGEKTFRLRELELTERLYPVESYPNGHPELATSLGNLGVMHLKRGELPQAQESLERARRMIEALYSGQLYPRGHFARVEFLRNYAVLQAQLGDHRAALERLLEAEHMQQMLLEDLFGAVSEQMMRSYLATRQGWDNMLVSALAAPPASLPLHSADSVYFVFQDRKTAVLDALLKLRYSQAQELSEEASTISKELRAARAELAALALRPNTDDGERRKKAEQVARLEAELNRRLIGTPLIWPPRQVLIPHTVAAYGPDAAVVDLIRFRPFNFQTLERGDPHYGAFVMRGKVTAQCQWIDLGPAEPVDALVAELRQQVEGTSRAIALSDEAELEEEFKAPARKLHDLVFAPLTKALDGATTIFLSPADELNRIPFEALVDADGNYLIENHQFAYISGGRDLIRAPGNPQPGPTVIFAAPDYKFDGQPAPPTEQLAGVLRGGPDESFSGELSPELRGLNWSPLPATVVEAAEIAKILEGKQGYGPVVQLTGAEALEDRLKDLRAPRILHLATHGYYLPNQVDDTGKDDAGSSDERGGLTAAGGLAALKRLENPLQRAGIVLAGANRPASDEAPAGDREDGWVTAEEIGLLNLDGTELVVLSACETGLGDVRTGEGVSGLRRAFAYAGAKTLVTSLYKVPDKDTQRLMVDFYRGLAEGKAKLTALRNAELAAIARRREEFGAAHPFFWASFILVGDPR